MKRSQKTLLPKRPSLAPQALLHPRFPQPQVRSSQHQQTSRSINTKQPYTMSTSPIPPPDPAQADTVLFRPAKKRKIYRQRATEDEPAPPSVSPPESQVAVPVAEAQSLDDLISTASGSVPGNGELEVENVSVSMAEILRLRKKNKARGGVEFKASGHIARDEEGELILRPDEEVVGSNGVPRKFAPQTGAVGDVNRHM